MAMISSAVAPTTPNPPLPALASAGLPSAASSPDRLTVISPPWLCKKAITAVILAGPSAWARVGGMMQS